MGSKLGKIIGRCKRVFDTLFAKSSAEAGHPPTAQRQSATKLICIISGQRSGSTALRRALCHSYNMTDLGEILHDDELENYWNFFSYCARRRIGLNELIRFDRAGRIIEDYLNSIIGSIPSEYAVLDIKFNCWNNTPSPWAYFDDEPLLLELLKDADCEFIFLTRSDKAAQSVSHQLSLVTLMWGRIEHDAVEPLELDVDEVVSRAISTVASERRFEKLLQHYPRKIDLKYEEMFLSDGAFSPISAARIQEFFDQNDPLQLDPYSGRSFLDKPTIVKNLGEINERLDEALASTVNIGP
ncbi:MAG: hypothetical protein R3E09_03910 [Novosphingobium sp.]